MTTHAITDGTCIVRNTGGQKGPHAGDSARAAAAASRHLHYGRIILDAGDAPERIETGGNETGLDRACAGRRR